MLPSYLRDDRIPWTTMATWRIRAIRPAGGLGKSSMSSHGPVFLGLEVFFWMLELWNPTRYHPQWDWKLGNETKMEGQKVKQLHVAIIDGVGFHECWIWCEGCSWIGQTVVLLLLMAQILHQLIGSLSHYLQGFIHLRWCRISSINSSITCLEVKLVWFELKASV